jgi:hypothetical protein
MLAIVDGFQKVILGLVDLMLQILVCKLALLKIYGSGKDAL